MDSPNQQNKHKWGWSQHLFVGPFVDVAVAKGQAGGCSSWHFHKCKSNSFVVREGCLQVEVKQDGRHESHVLFTGEGYTVKAGVLHRMTFIEDATLFEVYVAEPGQGIDLSDITRLDEGTEPCDLRPS